MSHFEGQGLTFTVAATAATYSAGGQVGLLVHLPNIVVDSGGALDIESLLVLDTAKQAKGGTLFLFNKAVVLTGGNNAAFAMSAADAAACVATITVLDADYVSIAAQSFAQEKNLRILAQTAPAKAFMPNSKDLWAAWMTSSTPTYTASCLQFTLGLRKQR